MELPTASHRVPKVIDHFPSINFVFAAAHRRNSSSSSSPATAPSSPDLPLQWVFSRFDRVTLCSRPPSIHPYLISDNSPPRSSPTATAIFTATAAVLAAPPVTRPTQRVPHGRVVLVRTPLPPPRRHLPSPRDTAVPFCPPPSPLVPLFAGAAACPSTASPSSVFLPCCSLFQ